MTKEHYRGIFQQTHWSTFSFEINLHRIQEVLFPLQCRMWGKLWDASLSESIACCGLKKNWDSFMFVIERTGEGKDLVSLMKD
jgi:hypothetical protein